MCNFLSGLTFSDFLLPTQGRCHADPCKTNSHSELVRLLCLNDVKSEGHFAKWEFVPSGDIADFDNYQFKLDEERVPDWWTPEIEAETIEYAKSVLRRVVLVTGVIDELRDDVYALAGNAVVRNLFSSVGLMRGSSSVHAMWESSSVGLMRESSSVHEMWGSSSVGLMRESSSVHEMWGSPSVGLMRESSQATVYTETAHVTLGENCNAVVIDRSAGSVKCHVSGKRKKVIGSPRGN